MNPNLIKIIKKILFSGGKGARVSDFFFTKNPNLKKIFFFGGGEEGGVAGRGWGWG